MIDTRNVANQLAKSYHFGMVVCDFRASKHCHSMCFQQITLESQNYYLIFFLIFCVDRNFLPDKMPEESNWIKSLQDVTRQWKFCENNVELFAFVHRCSPRVSRCHETKAFRRDWRLQRRTIHRKWENFHASRSTPRNRSNGDFPKGKQNEKRLHWLLSVFVLLHFRQFFLFAYAAVTIRQTGCESVA